MNRTRLPDVRIASIFHPSDFSEASEIAFAHALKFALVTKATLSMLHVSPNSTVADWQEFPGVRDTLERWKVIPPGSPRSAIGQLGFDVQKVLVDSNDPVKACQEFLNRNPADLIVLAVHQRDGRTRWLHKSVGEPIARGAGQMTLFVPHGVEGFVSKQDGSVSLRNILIPITSKPRPQPAIDAAARLIRGLERTAGTVTLLHVGPSREVPVTTTPESPGWTWNALAKPGEPADIILQTADAVAADLIVMTTDGPDGFLDGLRGTTSERVLRRSHCPVVNMPVGSVLG
jgi:nucleotide-binding universal stress UspA family protein